MRILIADGLAGMRYFLTMSLAEYPAFDFDQAGDTATATQLLATHQYDVVIADWDLLPGGAPELAQALRAPAPQRRSSTWVVLAEPGPSNAAHELQQAGAIILHKPVRTSQVREGVSKALGLAPTSAAMRPPCLPTHLVAQFAGKPASSLEIRDLRPFGAFVVANELEAVGTTGRIQVNVDNQDTPFWVDCRVVHIRPTALDTDRPRGFAVKFEPATTQDSVRLVHALVVASDTAIGTVASHLRKIPLFRDLDAPELARIREIVQERGVDANQLVVREGDPSDSFYIVKSGAVKIVKGKNPPQELAVLRAGDFFGEMGVLLGAPRSASVISMQPTALYRVDQRDWFDLLAVHAAISEKIQTTMVRRYAENVHKAFSERIGGMLPSEH